MSESFIKIVRSTNTVQISIEGLQIIQQGIHEFLKEIGALRDHLQSVAVEPQAQLGGGVGLEFRLTFIEQFTPYEGSAGLSVWFYCTDPSAHEITRGFLQSFQEFSKGHAAKLAKASSAWLERETTLAQVLSKLSSHSKMEKSTILFVGGSNVKSYVGFADMQTRFSFRYSASLEMGTFVQRFTPAPVGIVIDLSEYFLVATTARQGFESVGEAAKDLMSKIRAFWPSIQFYFLDGEKLPKEDGVFLLEHPVHVSPQQLCLIIDKSFATE